MNPAPEAIRVTLPADARFGISRRQRVLWPAAAFVASWILYFGLVFGLPVRYPSDYFWTAIATLVAFVGATALTALLVDDLLAPLASRTQHVRRVRCLSANEVHFLIGAALAFSAVGVLGAAYDRVVIQGIDYTQGIGVARHLWLSAGEERDSISSPFSVLGYVFGFTFFAAAALAHLHWEILSTNWRRLVIVGVVISLMANSFLSGNRSTVLLLGIMLLSTAVIRRMQGRKILPGSAFSTLIRVSIVSLVALTYGIYVFSARASAGGLDAFAYVDAFLPFLTAEATPAMRSFEKLPDGVSGASALGVMAGVYVAHSAGALGEVMAGRERPGQGSFAFARLLLSKLGIIREQGQQRLLEGRLLSMPGGIYYDFGFVGMFIAAALLGMGLVCVGLAVSRHWRGGIALAVTLAVMATVLATPVALSFDMLAFPFMLFGFVLLHLAHRLRYPPGSWWGSPVLFAARE